MNYDITILTAANYVAPAETDIYIDNVLLEDKLVIDALEAKGVENLTDDEFEHYAKLSDDLLATKELEIQYNEKFLATLN